MILNCNDTEANILIDIYFEDSDPIKGIPISVPPQRIKAFRSDDVEALKGLVLDVNRQYSIRFRSDLEVVVQYGRCDVAQPNLAYLATLGYGE